MQAPRVHNELSYLENTNIYNLSDLGFKRCISFTKKLTISVYRIFCTFSNTVIPKMAIETLSGQMKRSAQILVENLWLKKCFWFFPRDACDFQYIEVFINNSARCVRFSVPSEFVRLGPEYLTPLQRGSSFAEDDPRIECPVPGLPLQLLSIEDIQREIKYKDCLYSAIRRQNKRAATFSKFCQAMYMSGKVVLRVSFTCGCHQVIAQ